MVALLSFPAPWRKRGTALCAAVIAFGSISCFGQPGFLAVRSTPYDRQMGPVYPTLTSSAGKLQGPISLDTVNACMTQLRAMPYHFSPSWKTPMEVNFGQAADCKGKAVALYAQLRVRGARFVRIVIGKRHLYDANTHAWLQWETNAGSFTLDPTFNTTAIPTAELDPMTYIAFYAFDGEHKYRAGDSSVAGPNTRVATGDNNHLGMSVATASVGSSRFTGLGSPQFAAASTQYRASTAPYGRPGVPTSWPQPQTLARSVAGSTRSVAQSNSTLPNLARQGPSGYAEAARSNLTTPFGSVSTENGGHRTLSTSNGSRHRHLRRVAQHHHHRHSAQPKLASQA